MDFTIADDEWGLVEVIPAENKGAIEKNKSLLEAQAHLDETSVLPTTSSIATKNIPVELLSQLPCFDTVLTVESGIASPVTDGFAYGWEDYVIYGTQTDGIIQTLYLYVFDGEDIQKTRELLQILQSLAKYGLIINHAGEHVVDLNQDFSLVSYLLHIWPTTQIERQLLEDAQLQQGLMWGHPRPGHPEGEVIYHVREVLNNVEELTPLVPSEEEQLRLIALLHDSFKFKVDETKPKSGENHHGMIARRFAELYITDTTVLDIIELHDEAYNAWLQHTKGRTDVALARIERLRERLGPNLQLYYLFYKCDNQTGDKSQDGFRWFESLIF